MADSNTDVLMSMRDDMMQWSEEWKHGHGRNYSIIQASVAIVSLASSSLLIWILKSSPKGFSTIYHRLLLGMSFADILLSLYLATFGVTAPRELDYVVWNARGTVATCDATGFIAALGGISGLLYTCSLNLYYLTVVRYQKSDSYIKRRLEPWLHAVPVSFALVISIYFLVIDGMNSDMLGRCSFTSPVDYPHCIGYEEGDTPEGFKIPCGRGGGGSGNIFRFIIGLVVFLLVPVVVGVSLFLIYRSVSKQKKMSRYRSDASNVSAQDLLVQRNNNAVMYRAFAYSVSYLLTWMMTILSGLFVIGGASVSPTVQIVTGYLYSFLHPLQGLFTLLIFMHPQVMHERRSGNISWCKAFANALQSAVTGRKSHDVSVEQISTASNETSNNIQGEVRDGTIVLDAVLDADCCIAEEYLDQGRLEILNQEQATPSLQSSIPIATGAPVDTSSTDEGDRADNDDEWTESPSNEDVSAEASRASLPLATLSLQSSIPIATGVPDDTSSTDEGDRADNDDEWTESPIIEDVSAEASTASLSDIDRSIMEERGIPIATLERHEEESEESVEDNHESFDADRMTQALTKIGFIPELQLSRDDQQP